MSTLSTPRPKGFPNYFKKAGIALVILVILFAAVIKVGHVVLDPGTKALFRVASMNMALLGLLLIALARDKVEDEMITAIKLNVMARAFVFGSVLLFIDSFMELVSTGHATSLSGPRIVATMLCFYIAVYYFEKRKLK